MKETSNKNDRPLRCLLFGTGHAFWNYLNLVKSMETSGKIKICAITSKESSYGQIAGYKVIEKNDINTSEFDIVIIMSITKTIISEIQNELILLGVKEQYIIPCRVLKVIGFDFNKYISIKSNPPTLFTPCCWGGLTYNQLGLRFDSPLINMFEDHDDYLKFLINPKHYLSCELKLKDTLWEEGTKKYYPLAECDDILLHFNHYSSFEEANNSWNKRKQRINWNNIIVMFFDERPDRVERFCSLNYKNKICFVPYHSAQKNVVQVKYSSENKLFYQVINDMASGACPFYDVFDLLLNGTFSPIAEYK